MGRAGQPLLPLLPLSPAEQPWHSSQYQALPAVYVQNASLEIAWTRVVRESRTIAGVNIVPFLTEGYEGFDVNQPYDWQLAEDLVQPRRGTLPSCRQTPLAIAPDVQIRINERSTSISDFVPVDEFARVRGCGARATAARCRSSPTCAG